MDKDYADKTAIYVQLSIHPFLFSKVLTWWIFRKVDKSVVTLFRSNLVVVAVVDCQRLVVVRVPTSRSKSQVSGKRMSLSVTNEYQS